MNKTLNQKIYETPGDVKKAIHDIGYEVGYEDGKQAMLDRLKTGIETFLAEDDVEVIIAEGEVFVPISALRKIVADMED